MVAVLLRFCKAPQNDEIALQHFFFFLTAAQEFFSITFVLHAIFFFRQALVGNFFSKPPPRPLRKVRSGALYPGGLQSDVCVDYKKRGLYLAVYVMILS